jgi:hypothetical protein
MTMSLSSVTDADDLPGRRTAALDQPPPRRRAFRLAITSAALLLGGCAGRRPGGTTEGGDAVERRIADAMYAVISADRATYANQVVDRLQNQDKVLGASEHFKDEKKLPLPAQMLRMAADEVRKRQQELSFSLVSLWPINGQNGPRTDIERAGLHAVNDHPADPFGAEETLADRRYYTAVYPDRAVSNACVSCHNGHENSPRRDFKLGDVMGGIVIRVARR